MELSLHTALIINQSINCGIRAGIMCGVGAASADFTYALIAFKLGDFIQHFISGKEEILKISSSVILSAFGIWMILTSLRNFRQDKKSAKTLPLVCRKPFITTYLLTLANPLTIIVFSGISGQISIRSSADVIIDSIMLFSGSLVVQLFLATIGVALRRLFQRPKILTSLNILSGIGIILLSVIKYF
jgi:threonine/homoserine/homoserine lactone efflux protein